MQIIRSLSVIEEENAFNIFLEEVKNFFFQSDKYENFSFSSRMSSLRIFITALLIGVFAFTVVFAVKKQAAKRFVDAVLKEKSHDAESAKTLSELGLAEDKGVIRALRHGALSRMISTAEGDEYNEKNFGNNAETEKKDKKSGKKKLHAPAYRVDPEKDRFYLTEKKTESLASIYGGKTGVVSTVLLSAAVCIALWFVLDAAIPFFLSLLDARI